MNRSSLGAIALSVLALGAFAAIRNPAQGTMQEKTPATQAAIAPEMERLNFYVGEWDYTETYPKSGFYPQGGVNTGVYSSKIGPGGHSLLNSFHSIGPVGDFEGLLIFTSDPKEKTYKAYVLGNEFPGALVETGQFEADSLVFRSEVQIPGMVLKLRNVTRLTAPGRLISEQYSAAGDGPETLLVRVEAKKR